MLAPVRTATSPRLTSRTLLPTQPVAAPAARRLAHGVLSAWGVPRGRVGDVELVVTELMSNAVRHAGEDEVVELELTISGSALVVALADGSAVVPQRRVPGEDAESGRGLAIVEALADAWTVRSRPDGGKRVEVCFSL